MKSLRRFRQRLAGSVMRGRRDADLSRELDAHIEMMVDDLVGRGLGREEARRQVLLAFGGLELTKEQYRDQRGLPSLDAIRRDVRLMARSLVRTPALALIVILTLGLAIGANSAIFSLIDRVALRPLPVQRPEALVQEFAAEREADFPILSDPAKTVAEGYGVLGAAGFANRWTFYIGPDGKILDIDRKVSARTAGPDRAARLAALGVKKP
jgi:hypothetical protein